MSSVARLFRLMNGRIGNSQHENAPEISAGPESQSNVSNILWNACHEVLRLF